MDFRNGDYRELPHAGTGKAEAAGVKCFEYVGNTKPAEDKPAPSWRDRIFSAASLQHKIFPEIRMVVERLIPEGLSIFAGRPKAGKSWAALEIGVAVASESGTCLGGREVEHGAVLCLALEDSDRRLQRRITKLIGANKETWPERLKLVTEWKRLDQGGVQDLEAWITSTPEARLIIIDTFARVKPAASRNGGAYSDDYAALTGLQELAAKHGVAILVIHHVRKAEADDPFDTVSGTLGLTGCADTILVLQGVAGTGMTLHVTGRDVEQADLAMQFDRDAARWSIMGDAADVHTSGTRKKILEVLAKVKPNTMAPSDIAGAANLKVDVVKKRLGDMLAKGQVIKSSRGDYAHP